MNRAAASAQTALRNAIGQNDLAVLLSERDRLGHEIQKLLDDTGTFQTTGFSDDGQIYGLDSALESGAGYIIHMKQPVSNFAP